MKPEDPHSIKAQEAATRRRWLTLAEILAVVAVVISGLTLWNSYQQRRNEEAAKTEARQEAAAEAQTLLLRATPDRQGEQLRLTPAKDEQTIQSQTVAFPTPLGVSPVETVAEPRVEATWFARALLRLRDGNEARRTRGDQRLPVAITTIFFVDGATHRDTAIYDVGYRVEEGGLFDGSDVRLRGLSRIEGVAPERAQTRLDTLWQSRHPAPPPEED